MNTGTIDIAPDECDLATTLQAGQTFLWFTDDEGTLYDGADHDRYYTTYNGDVLICWQDDDGIHYRATGGLEERLEDRFRLHEPIDAVHERLQGHDAILDEALDTFRGLRVVNDPVFPTLISYLCSVQMRIPRIKTLVNTLAHEYGTPVEAAGREFLQFPTRQELAGATEDELRDLGIGYRAKYIDRTTDQLTEGLIDLDSIHEIDYRDAHERITELYGVGDKVADCVLLFGYGFTEAFPIDTWIRSAVETHYPEYHTDSYHGIAGRFRDRFGEDLGYAQQYLFHYMRQQEMA